MPEMSAEGAGAVDEADSEAPAPLCPCHGVPMLDRSDRPGWRCAVKQRSYDAAYRRRSGRSMARYHELKAAGLCVECGRELAVTETRCFDCANRLQENAIRYRH